MLTAEFLPLFGYVLIGVSLVLLFLWMWRFRQRSLPREPLETPTIKIISGHVSSEISERPARWHTLTRREKDVAELAASDKTDDEIACELSISVRTVESHLYHAYQKLDIRSRHELKYLIGHLEDSFDSTHDM